jgi:muramoyltetrapeptide carboxypeptidase
MMYNLKRAGWLDKLAGLVIGSFTDAREMDTPFGQTEYEIINNLVKEFDYPVCFNFPVGHQEQNFALKLGVEHELKVGEKEVKLKAAE